MRHQRWDRFSCSLDDILPGEDEAKWAIAKSKDSGLGPDGLAYSAYRACIGISTALIIALVHFLVFDTGQLAPHFLLSYMVFLQKKSYSYIPSGLKLYKALNLRPLSLSNTIVKLITTTLRIKLANHIGPQIHVAQKCLSGRNLLDLSLIHI